MKVKGRKTVRRRKATATVRSRPKVSTFLAELTTNDTVTENAMPAHSTTNTALLDLFFQLGTRNLSAGQVEAFVEKALAEDKALTRKILFYNRDARGGRGERASFRVALAYLAENHPDAIESYLRYVPEFGRWDDLFGLIDSGSRVKAEVVSLIKRGLENGDRLLAKWLPRKGEQAAKIRRLLNMTPKSYRKLLVRLTHVVETPMCANQWDGINYSQVPSRAGTIYAKAFYKHDATRYAEWRTSLDKPEAKTKINVGVLYPHEIVKRIYDDAYPFEAAWTALKAKYPSHDAKLLPVCDVSGSMNGLPLDVCVSLGIFLSEMNTGAFKDCFVTFSARPELQKLRGGLKAKIEQLHEAEWDMNTNLEAVFELVAKAAEKSKPEDVPTAILILSDMQFDQCVTEPNDNALAMIDRKFEAIGVKRPDVIFWNLRAVGGNVPVKQDTAGTALVSGFSPSVLNTILTAPKELDPWSMMLHTINAKRYDLLG